MMKAALLFFVLYVTKIKAQLCGIGAATNLYGKLFNDESDTDVFKSFDNRITGGTRRSTGDFPWAVYLKFGYDEACSGSIISPNYILTAKHCTAAAQQWGSITVSYGSGNVCQQNSQTTNKMFHSEGDKLAGEDIALIKLNTPLEFNENVNSICLSRNLKPKIDDKAVVAGYGNVFVRVKDPNIPPGTDLESTDITVTNDGDLNSVALSILNDTLCNCNCSDPKELLVDLQNKTEFCAGGVLQGTLLGDSGGPIMILDKNSMQWYQVGVTARGESQSTDDPTKIIDHGIYTDVSKFCDWIAKTTENEVVCSN